MTLADFIFENIDEILAEWVEFARSLAGGDALDIEGLRDHARTMLLAVATEMSTEQSDAEQRTKSRGQAPVVAGSDDTAAETHGDQRYKQGFKLDGLVAEFRALRATVIHLWTRKTVIDERTVYELTRFNEGIDQLLAESVVRFSKQLDRARELFMGVLGHDLRTDLQVILTCASRLEKTGTEDVVIKYVPYLKESAQHILGMAEDLLDVARTRLGTQIPVVGAPMNAGDACEEVMHAFQQLHPHCELRLQIEGDVNGRWDRPRIQQMLTNLVRNAFQHGDPTQPISLRVRRDGDSVVYEVHNYGAPIPPSLLGHVFEPLQQGDDPHDSKSLGLGLYIACTIANAHRGKLSVASSHDAGTTFTARLPVHGDG